MGKQLAFYLDSTACTGCKTCQIACKDRNDLPTDVNWRRVLQYEGGNWIPSPDNPNLMTPNNVFVYSLSIACNHCEDALCVQVCPTGAMHKREDGVVLIDSEKCIGCRYCEWACPYSGPQYDESVGRMTKCDFCQDLIAEGKNPVCVDACPMRALEFGELDELRAKYGDVNAIEPLPASNITGPSLVITPHKDAQFSGEGTGWILDLEEV